MNEIKINHSRQLPRGKDRMKLLPRRERDSSLGYHSFPRCERMTKLGAKLGWGPLSSLIVTTTVRPVLQDSDSSENCCHPQACLGGGGIGRDMGGLVSTLPHTS